MGEYESGRTRCRALNLLDTCRQMGFYDFRNKSLRMQLKLGYSLFVCVVVQLVVRSCWAIVCELEALIGNLMRVCITLK